ncbi:hypothetical protein PENTCL1PPCAC_10621, partial [Pristionchus entomophagus]
VDTLSPSLPQYTTMRGATVVLDVEGVLFKTQLATLTSIRSGTLAQLVAGGEWKKQLDQAGHLFIDRDSRIFPVILAFLRDGSSLPLPRDEWMLQRIAHEARYFNLPDLERLANSKQREISEKEIRGGEMEERKPATRSLSVPDGKASSVEGTASSKPSDGYEKADKVEIPMKKSEVDRKLKRKPSLLNHLSISLPRNFAHIAHIGWKGSELILSTSSSSKEKDPQMRAMAEVASQSSASQVYNLVDGDSSRYGSQGVEVLISSQSIRSLPHPKKAPIPPFRPPPPLDEMVE